MEEVPVAEPQLREIGITWRRLPAALLIALRCTFGLVFLFAGIQKARDLTLFAADLQGYHILPDLLISPVASYLPFLEMVVGTALILRIAYPGALLLSGAMLSIFLLALGSALWRGLDIDCGCFGHAGGGRSLATAMGVDALLFAIYLLLCRHLLKAVSRQC